MAEPGEFEVNDETYLAALCRCVPYHIVERVLADPSEAALEAQITEGSVLSADVVGFTALNEQLATGRADALGAVSKILDAGFTAMQIEALFPLGGRITEFGGDAVTAVFVGPDHARRAVDAGLRIVALIEREAQAARLPEVQALRLRAGVASGAIHLATVGDLVRRLAFTGGATTHRAVSVQGLAAISSCAIDRSTLALVGDGVTVVDHGGDIVTVTELTPRMPDQPFEILGDRVKYRTRDAIQILEPFVPAPLARRLRTTPNGWRLEPEIRRDVVVAFADIAGFQGLSPEILAPGRELARSLLRAFHKYDGLVLKCMATEKGHRVMVLFGAHQQTGNECERAVLAALDAIGRFRAFQQAISDDLEIALGIHRGPVFFGGVGSRSKHDLTALGDTVNVAARAASAAQPFTVVATASVAKEVDDIFAMTSLGEMRAKGKRAPLLLHHIHGVKGGRAHYARRRSSRRFSAGRAEQEAELERRALASHAGQGAVIGIMGDAGTGKSHLLSNLVDRWIELGGSAIVTRCLYANRTIPLAPIRELFDAFLGLGESDAQGPRTGKIRRRLNEIGYGYNDPELLALLQPVRRPDGFEETLIDLSDPDTAERLLTSIIRFVERRIEQAHVLYILEDIQVADSMTLRLIEKLSRLRKDRPYLFVATYRPDPRLENPRGAFDAELTLPNLAPEDTLALVRHETRATSVDSGLIEFLWQRGEGNPEHLIETLRFLSERWLIRVDPDGEVAPVVARAALDEIVPPTWAQVAVARLDGATELERRILRVASAIGYSFQTEVVAAVDHQIPGEVVETALRGLEAQLWVTPEVPTRQAFRFRDQVARSVAYSMIPEGERRALHRRIANALQKVSGVPSLLPALAHHWERAGELSRAAQLWEQLIRQLGTSGLAGDAEKFIARIKGLREKLKP